MEFHLQIKELKLLLIAPWNQKFSDCLAQAFLCWEYVAQRMIRQVYMHKYLFVGHIFDDLSKL